LEKKIKRHWKQKKLKEELDKVVKIQVYYLVFFKLWFHHLSCAPNLDV
jgi:hypothetical protein